MEEDSTKNYSSKEYKCIKMNLETILKDSPVPLPSFLNKKVDKKETYIKLNDAVIRGSHITQKTYLLLRLWVLKKYHENIEIPLITNKLIGLAMCSLLKDKNESKFSKDNLLLYKEFKNLHSFKLEDGTYLRVPLDYYCIKMVTSIENNIKNNFILFLSRFVNSYFYKEYEKEIENKETKDKLIKELRFLKNDIINGTKTCNQKYHEWLETHRYKIIPSVFNKNIYFDIKTRPQSYLKYMIYMNIELEKKNAKMFHFFPLQTSSVPVHFDFDTTALNELLYKKIKKKDDIPKEENDNVIDASPQDNMTEEKKKIIWNTFFNIKMDDEDVKKKYKFDYTIITDGYSVSIRYVEKEKDKKNQVKNKKMLEGRNKKKGMTKEEISKQASIKQELKEKEKQELFETGENEYEENKEEMNNKMTYKFLQSEIIKLERRIESLKQKKLKLSSAISKNKKNIENLEFDLIKRKEELTNLPIDNEQYEIKPFKKKSKISQEFLYIDEVDKTELEGTHIFIDPGKRSLLTMMNDDGKFLSYTNKKWLSQTCRIKYRKRIEKRKKEHDKNEEDEDNHIFKKEEDLSKLNSKSCDISQFETFMKTKVEGNNDFYENPLFRKYKWYGYINKKRAIDKMLNLIEDTYNKDRTNNLKIIIGDWSIGKQMRNFISTPNISLKRKLKERFKHVYNIDEYKTSCISHNSGEKCGNLYLKKDNSDSTKIEMIKMYSILTYKMENKRLGCINRDKNSCKNIKKIFDYFIKTGDRPDVYKRKESSQDTDNPAPA